MAEEITFFQGENIIVTNARFVVGAQTFAMRGITSVEGVEIPASFVAPVIGILLGLIMALNLFNGGIGLGIIGVLIFAAAICLAIYRKSTFVVVLRTAGGEVTAYQSTDKNYIAQIIRALNEAIISQG